MASAPFTRLRPADAPKDELEVGFIQGAFGVRGEVKLFLHNHDTDLFHAPRDVVLIDGEGVRYAARLSSRSGAGKRILGQLERLTDRDVAESLRGWRVVVDTATLPELADDEFYMWQLEGAAVVVEGEVRGTVQTVQTTEGGDVLVVDTDDRLVFVPCVKAWVLRIDIDAAQIELAPGALEDE